jgi:hypothetical protein
LQHFRRAIVMALLPRSLRKPNSLRFAYLGATRE